MLNVHVENCKNFIHNSFTLMVAPAILFLKGKTEEAKLQILLNVTFSMVNQKNKTTLFLRKFTFPAT